MLSAELKLHIYIVYSEGQKGTEASKETKKTKTFSSYSRGLH